MIWGYHYFRKHPYVNVDFVSAHGHFNSFCRRHGSSKVISEVLLVSCRSIKICTWFCTCDLIGFMQWFILDISPMYPNVSPTICEKHNRSLSGSETAIQRHAQIVPAIRSLHWLAFVGGHPQVFQIFLDFQLFFSGSQKTLIEGCMLYLSNVIFEWSSIVLSIFSLTC